MAEYNFHDMEQAKRRVMEMQRRSKNYTDNQSADPPSGGSKPPRPPETPPAHPEQKPSMPTPDPLAGLMNLGAGLGGDRTLILLLLVLLWGEKTDRLLLLALLYCAL